MPLSRFCLCWWEMPIMSCPPRPCPAPAPSRLWLLLWSHSISELISLLSCCLVFFPALSFLKNPASSWYASSRTASVLSCSPPAMFQGPLVYLSGGQRDPQNSPPTPYFRLIKFFSYSGYTLLLRCMICKYLLCSMGCISLAWWLQLYKL